MDSNIRTWFVGLPASVSVNSETGEVTVDVDFSELADLRDAVPLLDMNKPEPSQIEIDNASEADERIIGKALDARSIKVSGS